jgi:glycosyltransferase involved in cell wall biosynthesis
VNVEIQHKITIGITCYNASSTIERAIESARQQQWDNLEIIIVDDFSTDDSVDIIRQSIGPDTRARLIQHTVNKGAAAARNTIIEAASGDFIVFFDDDDESQPGRLRGQIDTLHSFEKLKPGALVACYAAGDRIYANGYVKPLPAIGTRGIPPHGAEVANYLLFYGQSTNRYFGSGTPTCALMARRETFQRLNGFDTSLRRVEDIDFAIRLALEGGYFIGTETPLFRQFATDGSDKSPEANRNSEVLLAKKHAGYLRSVGRYHYALNWPKLRYLHHKRRYLAFTCQFLVILARNPLLAMAHILSTGPRRLRHERKMRKPRT